MDGYGQAYGPVAGAGHSGYAWPPIHRQQNVSPNDEHVNKRREKPAGRAPSVARQLARLA